ncbi:MAG: DUF1003 domain-containing protein [Armatimonadetes bacterium]|nr:DUF1003 domain-containing protein [Armatimonadota bacterium]
MPTEMLARNPEEYHKPTTADELTERNVAIVADLENAAKQKRTPTDRVVDAITGFCGRMTFVWVHVVWFGLWMTVNVLPHIPRRWHFDPYPWPLLLMIVNLEAIFLSTFILISQNRQSRLAERRSHLDLQINLLSEQENTKMLAMLESIVKRLDIPDGDPEVAVLEEGTQPGRLVQQIEETIEREDKPARNPNGRAPR